MVLVDITVLFCSGGMRTNMGINAEISSEGFDQIPFYRDLNLHHLRDAPMAQTILDVGTGIGSAIQWLYDLRKIRSPFNITLVDINEVDLVKARSRLAGLVDQAAGDSLTFVKRSADELGEVIADRSVGLITALNSIHLYPNPEEFFHQAALKLVRGGELFVSSAYVTDVMFPDPMGDRRAWGRIVLFPRIDLRPQGFTNIPDPKDPAKYSSGQYIEMAQKAGLEVTTEVYNAYIPRDELKQLVVVDEFVDGALPDIPKDLAKNALQNAVDKTLDRLGASGLNRGWLLMRAIIP